MRDRVRLEDLLVRGVINQLLEHVIEISGELVEFKAFGRYRLKDAG